MKFCLNQLVAQAAFFWANNMYYALVIYLSRSTGQFQAASEINIVAITRDVIGALPLPCYQENYFNPTLRGL